MNGDAASNSSNYALFQKEIKADKLTGTVEIQGLARVGCTLKAVVSDTNNSGILAYQWKADGVPIERATEKSYVLTDAEEGKRITVEVRSSWETDSIESENATDPVIKVVVLNDHIIINQVFGGGENEGASISHSFIELYNPTKETIRLDGYKIGYYSGRMKNGVPEPGYTEDEVYLSLDGTKEIPPNCSYLIRCEAQKSSEMENYMLTIDSFDQQWSDQTIANKQYKAVLYHDSGEGDTIEDAVSVNEEAVEGIAILDPPGDEIVSKHKTVRRKYFADTDNNSADFEVISYRSGKISESDIAVYRPRSLTDGAWGVKEPDPQPIELKGSVSIRGNAIAGAHLYADIALDPTGYNGDVICKWKANGVEVKEAAGRFLPTDASYAGKKISVEVTSADETVEGILQASMTSEMEMVEAQRDHVNINQVYGDGDKKDVPLSHSFIELYNPTNKEVDLNGYSIQYQSNGITEEISLSGAIPSRHSYLIRCKASRSADAAPVQVAEGDAGWESLTIDNKQYRILLKNGADQIDGVSVNEDKAEGTPLTDPDPLNDDTIISKKKAVRRISFVDTDENASDFETLNYTNLYEWELEEILATVMPRSTADGAWGLKESEDNQEPSEEILQEADKAKQEAENIEKSQYTEESYHKLQTAYAALLKALESKDAGQIVQATADLNEAIRKLDKVPAKGNNEEKKDSLVGTQFISNKGWYQITKDSGTEYTVTYLKPTKKTFKNAKVMSTVSYKGTSYKVTAIAAKAFAKNKKLRSVTVGKYVETIGASAFAGDGQLKKITVQTNVLKNVGKKALKGIHKDCKIKVPGKKWKNYQKKFKKKGQKSSVRIVK